MAGKGNGCCDNMVWRNDWGSANPRFICSFLCSPTLGLHLRRSTTGSSLTTLLVSEAIFLTNSHMLFREEPPFHQSFLHHRVVRMCLSSALIIIFSQFPCSVESLPFLGRVAEGFILKIHKVLDKDDPSEWMPSLQNFWKICLQFTPQKPSWIEQHA